jgi:hypothetical protein
MKLHLIAILLGVGACTDFPDVSRDVCGNGLLEAGEDCDSDDASCVRCAVTCSAAVDCPTADYTCGVDGFCHAPGGLLAEPTAPVTFQADDVRITDIDRDGTGDVLGVSKTSIIVRHGDATGSLASSSSFVTPAQSGPHGFGDLDGDGTIDVTLSTLDGIVSYTSRFGTLSPVAIESPVFDENGNALNLRHLFSVGQFQLGGLIEDGGATFLVVIDLLPPGGLFSTPPCFSRVGAIAPEDLPLSGIEIYRASPAAAANKNFVFSFLTGSGQPCVTSLAGSTAAGFTFTDITPVGANTMTTKPVFADLDNDSDPCPSLINSDGGAAALRHWNGRLLNGRCTLDAGGPDGVVLPPIAEAPSSAVAVGHVPLDPPITVPFPPFPTLGPDALVLTSGLYAFVPDLGGFGEIYSSSSRVLAHVATGDLDNDGDIDVVLATADEDDLDVLFRFPLGLQLLRVDTASEITSLTLGDFDGNGVTDIAYTETETDHQNMMIAYGTSDRPLDPVQVASFSGVSSVTPLQFPDSVDTLAIAEDLAIIHVDTGGLPTMSLLHGSPQRTMLSFFDPRDDQDQDGVANTLDNPRQHSIPRNVVIGELDGSPAHPDLLLIATPVQNSTLGMRAWRVPGTDAGLDSSPNAGMAANGLSNCDGLGVCVASVEYLAWRGANGRDLVIAIDRENPARAAVLDPSANEAGFGKTEIPMLVEGVPAGAVVRSLYAADLDGDSQPELVIAFGTRSGAPAGIVRVCQMSATGVPQDCDDLTTVIATADPDVTACIDAAPGRIGARGPTVAPVPGADLVVLCQSGESTALFRVSHQTGSFVAAPLARASGLRSLRVDDVTGDGVHDVIAVQGSGGSQSLVVFAQCSSREIEACQTAAGDAR